MWEHISTEWAISAFLDCYYNQTPMGKYVTQNYMKKLGLENVKSFSTRGVILDMVRVFKEAGKLPIRQDSHRCYP